MKFTECVSAAWAIVVMVLLYACATGERHQSPDSVPSTGTWSSRAPMPVEIGEVTLATTGGKIYVIGGSTGDTVDQRLNQEIRCRDQYLAQPCPLAARHDPCSGHSIKWENLCCRSFHGERTRQRSELGL